MIGRIKHIDCGRRSIDLASSANDESEHPHHHQLVTRDVRNYPSPDGMLAVQITLAVLFE